MSTIDSAMKPFVTPAAKSFLAHGPDFKDANVLDGNTDTCWMPRLDNPGLVDDCAVQ